MQKRTDEEKISQLRIVVDTLTSERDSLKLQLEGRTYSHSDEKVEAELVEARKDIERLTKRCEQLMDERITEVECMKCDHELRAEGLEASLISAGKDNEKLEKEKATLREALIARDGGAHDVGCKSESGRGCNCGHDATNKALQDTKE